MQNYIVTGDVYESCFYILQGCTLVSVEGTPHQWKNQLQAKVHRT